MSGAEARTFLYRHPNGAEWGVFLNRHDARTVAGRAVRIVPGELEAAPEVRFVMLADVAPREFYATTERLQSEPLYASTDRDALRGITLARLLPQ